MEYAVRTDVPQRYAPAMAGRKVSSVIDQDTWRLARELAQHDGISLSAWLARAARHQARVENGRRAVAEYEAEEGPIPEDALRRADEWLDEIGVPRPPV
jgi:hypothetical protein